MKLSIMTVSPASPKETERNINNAKRLGFPRIGKAGTPRLAVVGGGPSIKNHIEELKAFDGDIWAINGAFQWCKENGINAWFFSVDPSDLVAKFCKGAKRAMVVMDCHPTTFKALSSAKVEAIDLTGLPHGPSSSTSAPTIGLMRGYKEFYFYGCEGNFAETTHAYGDYGLEMLLQVRCNGEDYMTTADMMIQVEHLGDLLRADPNEFQDKSVRFIDKSGGLLANYVKDPNISVEAASKHLYDAVVQSHKDREARAAAVEKEESKPPEKPTGILICCPAGGQMVSSKTTEALFATGQWLTREGIPNQLSLFSAADIEDIRNLFITNWYDTQPQFSHLLFVDADMGFHPMLIRDMIRFNKPLVGCLYARRQMPASVVGTVPEGHSFSDIKDGFMLATGLGCGVMLISREVIKTMLEVMPELSDEAEGYLLNATEGKLKRIIRCFDKYRSKDLRLSEDMAFCHRWRLCGGEIWANVDHKISHVGPFDYHLRYAGILEGKAQAERAAA
jgi:hypothetical protein